MERGFSVNKEVETCNLPEDSLEAQRLICNKVGGCGGVIKVPLTKELLASAASDHSIDSTWNSKGGRNHTSPEEESC